MVSLCRSRRERLDGLNGFVRPASGNAYPYGRNPGASAGIGSNTTAGNHTGLLPLITEPIHSSTFSSCGMKNCECPGFFFIVAEGGASPVIPNSHMSLGAWILRCRCKHKHTEHDPTTHQCLEPKCDCERFLSPWVCNCNHPWSNHSQLESSKQVLLFLMSIPLTNTLSR